VKRLLSVRFTLFAAAFLLILLQVPAITRAAGSSVTCPNESSPGFRTYLPDCRAYELVTPPYKEGVPPTLFGSGIMAISMDGEQVLDETLASVAGLENPGLVGNSYDFKRTESGWTTSPLEIPLSKYPLYKLIGVSPDLASQLWLSHGLEGSNQEYSFSSPAVPLTLMGLAAPKGDSISALAFKGSSTDLLHAVFIAHSPQIGSEEPTLWPSDPTVGEGTPSLYEYVGTGNSESGPILVGVKDEHRVTHIGADDSDLVSDCGTVLGDEEDEYNAISENGATIFFTAAACGGSPEVNELYARVGQEKTVAISEPVYPPDQGTGSDPEECNSACRATTQEPATFAGASADGSKVFFLTSQPLLNSDNNVEPDLYEAEIEGEGAGAEGEGAHARIGKLVQVSQDPNAGQAAEVQGVARVSEDGSHVYFVAKGILTTEPDLSLRSGHQTAVEHEDNLYVYERDAQYPNGHIAFIATLQPADEEDWRSKDLRPVQSTPDGRFLVFQSTADLTPDQEDRETEATQVFEYDTENQTLVRASQGQDGYNEDGNTSEHPATIPVQGYRVDSPVRRFEGLAVSADGSYVFFSSEDVLTSQALSGSNNVYEYHEGQIALISDGHDSARLAESPATELVGTDESGGDVFFTTADSLVPQDTDTQVNLYDARIDGGFAPVATPAPCTGDSCQEPSTAALSLLMPGMASPVQEVGVSQPKVASKKKPVKPKSKKKKKKKRKAKAKKGSARSDGKVSNGRRR
jgi:hypothetical protein